LLKKKENWFNYLRSAELHFGNKISLILNFFLNFRVYLSIFQNISLILIDVSSDIFLLLRKVVFFMKIQFVLIDSNFAFKDFFVCLSITSWSLLLSGHVFFNEIENIFLDELAATFVMPPFI
jgi:hypothetical protein